MITTLLIIGGLFLYFLPSIIAWNKRNADAIVALNLFLGWTFIGWVIALVWAFVNDTPNVIIKKQKRPKEMDHLDKLKKLKELLDTQAITEEEYNREKNKILGNELITRWDFKK